ncbi:MAG: hypothetical protein ABSG90_07820 [Dehalococcoidia bacterium]
MAEETTQTTNPEDGKNTDDNHVIARSRRRRGNLPALLKAPCLRTKDCHAPMQLELAMTGKSNRPQ